MTLIAGNWKMYKGPAEAAEFCLGLREHDLDGVDVVVCPPFVSLAVAVQLLAGTEIAVAAQNAHWEPEGAYTGEVSPAMLKDLCQWVIVGHSERRLYLGETDDMVAKKTAAVLSCGLSVIMCVGELADHYDAGTSNEVVGAQVKAGLVSCSADDSARLVIAYEPVWAIGTGKSADPEHAYKTMRLIRRIVGEMIGAGAARKVRILYGGSVNSGNVQAYVELPYCDGCLVGGASLDATEFAHIVKITAEVYGHR